MTFLPDKIRQAADGKWYASSGVDPRTSWPLPDAQEVDYDEWLKHYYPNQYIRDHEDEFGRLQSQMDQAKQTFVELAPLISNFYKGLRKDPEISRLEAIALTGAAFWGLAQESRDDR